MALKWAALSVAFAEAHAGFFGCISTAIEQKVARFMSYAEPEEIDLAALPLSPRLAMVCGLWGLFVLLGILGVTVLVVDCARSVRGKGDSKVEREASMQVPACRADDAGQAKPEVQSQGAEPEPLPDSTKDLQMAAKHAEEIQRYEKQVADLKKDEELSQKERDFLWEDAKRQRQEANGLQAFAISAANSLRKMQQEVDDLQEQLILQKSKYAELQQNFLAHQELMMLQELGLSTREAKVSALTEADKEELAQLREWVSAPAGAKDEHLKIAELRKANRQLRRDSQLHKASWTRAIQTLTWHWERQKSWAEALESKLRSRDLFDPDPELWEKDLEPIRPVPLELPLSPETSSPQVFSISSPRSSDGESDSGGFFA
ncbi:unnamed protein product [Effrenium voratum]|uniref:Uncharacterized protein n=1 Tax=Effrenium voratum TaxID=2562239 RepID=A0AA36NG37_9DINO|nr:unnamed protein product [Effrenium voratum]CAJ1459282.1 unnamed protein product [Effrenium voratum]